MRAEGICTPAITAMRGVPLPTTARDRDEDHITARLERARQFVSPIVIANPGEFTREQLAGAGYRVPSEKKPKVAKAPAAAKKAPAAPSLKHPKVPEASGVPTVATFAPASGAKVATQPRVKNSPTQKPPRAPSPPAAPQRQKARNSVKRTQGSRTTPAPPTAAPSKASRANPAYRLEQAVAEHAAGQPMAEIAARHGACDTTIRNAAKAAGHPTRPPGSRPRVPEAEIVRLYVDERLSAPKVADRLGLSPRTVRTALDRLGVPRRDDRATNNSGASRSIPEPVLRRAGEMYASGLTRGQVAQRLGIHIRVVDKGIDLVGAIRRPAAHIPGAQPGVDRAAALKSLMRSNDITSRDVRTWARETGRACSDVGIPPRALVEDYLLTRQTGLANAVASTQALNQPQAHTAPTRGGNR